MLTHTDPWAVVGIVLSLVIFSVTYRQTIGASKERAQNANLEIDNILLKRSILDGISLTRPMIDTVIEGKAISHRVRVTDLHSAEEALTVLYTATLESDFVPPEKRTAILESIGAVLSTHERATGKEADAAVIAAEKVAVRRRSTEWVSILIAVIASAVGGISVIVPDLLKASDQFFTGASRQQLYTAFLVGAASLALLSITLGFLRLRETQQETSQEPTSSPSGAFVERQVLKLLEEFKIPTSIASSDSAYDFNAEVDGKKVLVEVKSWPRRVPLPLLRAVIRRLKSLIDQGKGDESWLVTRDPVTFPEFATMDPSVRLMSLRELRNYLQHHRE